MVPPGDYRQASTSDCNSLPLGACLTGRDDADRYVVAVKGLPATAGMCWGWWGTVAERAARRVAWASSAGVLSVLAAAVSLRLTTAAIALPWGRGTWATSDTAAEYMAASTMIRFGWIAQNPDVGLPDGLDLGRSPLAEIHQWLLLKAVTMVTDDAFVALNVFFLLGFFAVGFASFLLLDATTRVRWLALILAVALATLPWHYSRFHHAMLADYSPVPVFLLLAFLMWSGWWSQSRTRWVLALLGAVYVGTSGVYYPFFACLVLGPVLLSRLVGGRREQWWRDVAVVVTIPVAMIVSLMAHLSLAASPSVGSSLVERVPEMSLGFAGYGPSLVVAWPFYDSVAEGAAQFSVLVAISFLVSVVALVAFTIGSIRGRLGQQSARLHTELQPWFLLLIWALLWFVPGLGWLFALTVTPEIRSWGRLSLVIGYITVVILGILLRELASRSRRAGLSVAAGVAVLLAWQVAVDHRPLTIPEQSTAIDAAGQSYAGQLRQVLDQGCPILQLPALAFPEEWREEWEDVGMAAYDHMWVQLYAPDYRWSFGAPRGTPGAALAQERYAQGVPPALDNAQRDGFCAVHVDRLGLTDEEFDQVRQALGEPRVELDRWTLFPLSGAAARESGP